MKVLNFTWIPSNLNRLNIYNEGIQNQKVMDVDKEDRICNQNLGLMYNLQVVANQENYGNVIDVDLISSISKTNALPGGMYVRSAG